MTKMSSSMRWKVRIKMTARELIRDFNNPEVDFALNINAVMKALEIALDALDEIAVDKEEYSAVGDWFCYKQANKAKAKIDWVVNESRT